MPFFSPKKIQTKFLSLFLLFSFVFFTVFPPQASAWLSTLCGVYDDLVASDTVNRMITEAAETAEEAATAAVQATIVTTLNNLVMGTIGGGGGAPGFITDWQDFLNKAPTIAANMAINDFISQTAGRRTGSGYEGFGGVVTTYNKKMATWAAQLTVDAQKNQPRVNFYHQSNLFYDGTLKGLGEYLTGVNNPWSFNLTIASAYQQEKAKQENIARTKAVAGAGYLGKEVNGKTVTPGSTYGNLVANMDDFAKKIVATAKSPSSLISSSLVTGITNTLITAGIGAAAGFVQGQINTVTDKINTELAPHRGMIGLGLNALDALTSPPKLSETEKANWQRSGFCKEICVNEKKVGACANCN